MTKKTIAVRLVLLALAAGSLGWYGCSVVPLPTHAYLDDAYMFPRYARHWLTGAGFSWNADEGPAYGLTSTSYLLLVTVLRAATDLPDAVLLARLSTAAGLGAVLMLAAGGCALFTRLRVVWAPLLVIPAMVPVGLFAYHSSSGMDTMAAMFANAVLGVAALHFANRRTPVALASCLVAAYAAWLTRPDMGLFALLLPPLLLLADDRRQWRWAARYGAVFIVVMAADLLFKLVLFGSCLPLPFYAKAAGFYRGYLGEQTWNPAREMMVFLRAALPFLLVTICLFTRRGAPRLLAFGVPLALTLGYLATVVQIMGMEARFYYPMLSFVALAAMQAAEEWLAMRVAVPGGKWRPHPAAMLLALVLLAAVAAPAGETYAARAWLDRFMREPVRYTAQRRYPVASADKLPVFGDWRPLLAVAAVLDGLPLQTVLAASEYGYVGARHPGIKIIDLAGLHDREFVANGFSAERVLAGQPDLIWLPHRDYSYARQQLLDSDTFALAYDYYPDVFDHGVAVRRGGAAAADIREAVRREFVLLYPGRELDQFHARVNPGAAETTW